ncbi:hypothetical protein Tco_0172400 [Tanacetum coccineum]
MVNARHKEVLKGSTSKEAGSSASDADHGDSGSSFSNKSLNFRGFTLSSMKLRQVGKAIKNAMPYYITPAEEVDKILEEFETLMQTNETVKELLKKFNVLIPYCPGYHGNEKLKVERFQKMLCDDI